MVAGAGGELSFDASEPSSSASPFSQDDVDLTSAPLGEIDNPEHASESVQLQRT